MGMGMGMGMNVPGSSTPPDLGLRPLYLGIVNGVAALPGVEDFDNAVGESRAEAWPESFPDTAWSPDLLSVQVATEFAGRFGVWAEFETALGDMNVMKWQPGSGDWKQAASAELRKLTDLVAERDKYMPEIVEQAGDFTPYFAGMVGLDRGRMRHTLALLYSAARVGEMVAMHFKRRFSRPRPSALMPSLAPPFGPPGHPSYPSGHATQAHLMVMPLCKIDRIEHRYGPQLKWLAKRIAENRERLGVHFASDSAGGRLLADKTFKELVEIPSCKALIEQATEEWKPHAG
jgi:membrane-associated phospholipid phosphatase